MKKRILTLGMLLLMCGAVHADNWGLWDAERSYIRLDTGSSLDVYSLWDSGTGTFDGSDLGSFETTDTLEIDAFNVKTWKDSGAGGNVTGVEYFYRVYETGSPTGAHTSLGGGWISDLGSDNQQWGVTDGSLNVDLLDGLSVGDYTLEVFGRVDGTGDPTGSKYDNNNGNPNNYSATFEVIPEPATMGLALVIGTGTLFIRRLFMM